MDECKPVHLLNSYLNVVFLIPLNNSQPAPSQLSGPAAPPTKSCTEPSSSEDVPLAFEALAPRSPAPRASGVLTCGFCPKQFYCLSKLRTHERVHTGQKPFSCKTCGKCFSQTSTLRRHERSHAGLRPFPCRVCSKAFTSASSLRVHERTHTGLRLFPCARCHLSFTDAAKLYAHEAVHARKKPFVCRVCAKAFVHAASLRSHELLHKTCLGVPSKSWTL